MSTYVCLFRNKSKGGFYVKAFSASNRKVAENRGREWEKSMPDYDGWKYAGCSTEGQFVTRMRKRMEEGGTRGVFGMLSSPVSEEDQETIYLWYDYRRWERDVRKPTKGVRAAVEDACKAIIKKSKKTKPILVFGAPWA